MKILIVSSFRQGNYISPHFIIMMINVLKNIFVICLKLFDIKLSELHWHKERFVSLKNEEITGNKKKNKWRNMVFALSFYISKRCNIECTYFGCSIR